MPQIVKNENLIKLRDIYTNRELTKEFLNQFPHPLLLDGLPELHNCSLLINKEQDKIRLVQKSNPLILYAVDIKVTHNHTVDKKCCTQIQVWRSSDPRSRGIPSVVFQYLLSRYIILITDDQQTLDGKRFWEDRIAEAFNKDNYVYYYDTSIIPSQLERIGGLQEFYRDYEYKGWRTDNEGKGHLFLISKDKIQ